MIYLTGDIHGEYDISKLNNNKNTFFGSNDYLIITGDFGLVWDFKSEKTSKHWRDWLDKKVYTTLFIPGNHENYDRLLSDEFSEVDMFNGKVKQISKKIFMLQTGHIYIIDGKKVFTFGGAESVDKDQRKAHISWWVQEIPSYVEFYNGLKVLEDNDNEVDLVISHAVHLECFTKLNKYLPNTYRDKEKDPLTIMLQSIKDTLKYKLWVCGHYHLNCYDAGSKTVILYNLVVSYDELKVIVDKGKQSFLLNKL